MNKKLVVLPVAVLLALLMAGEALAPTVNACTDTQNSPIAQEPLPFFWSTATPACIDPPFMACQGTEWQSGDKLFVRGLVCQDNFVLIDAARNCLLFTITFNINSNVNLENNCAITWVNVTLRTFDGWWQGDTKIKAAYDPNDCFFISNGNLLLCGQGEWIGWNMTLNFSVCNDNCKFTAAIWDPCACSWVNLAPIGAALGE